MTLRRKKKPSALPETARFSSPPSHTEQDHTSKIERILAALDQATEPAEMDLPGFYLEPLKGQQKGHYSVWVSGTWRMTFRFRGKQAVSIDYIDSA